MSHGNGIARPRGAAATRVLANALEGTRDIRQHFPRVENSPDAPIPVGENGEDFEEPALAPRAIPHPQHAALLPNAPAAGGAMPQGSDGEDSDALRKTKAVKRSGLSWTTIMATKMFEIWSLIFRVF